MAIDAGATTEEEINQMAKMIEANYIRAQEEYEFEQWMEQERMKEEYELDYDTPDHRADGGISSSGGISSNLDGSGNREDG